MNKIIITLAAILSLTAPSLFGASTQEEQKRLSPQEILNLLMEGNERFQNGYATQRDFMAEAKQTASGQYPLAVIVSCLDSRVPVETVFDQGIGDLFVGRVAGNIEDTDMLGSLEFATAAAGSKVVMVMGHEACGAVKGAIDGVELGNLTHLLNQIEPAMEAVSDVEGPRTSANPEFVNAVSNANVLQTLADIRERSPLLAEREAEGKILLVGAMYSLEDGAVTLVKEGEAAACGHAGH